MAVERNTVKPRPSDPPSAEVEGSNLMDYALEAGGYIVSEPPCLLRNDRFLAVVNNKKCVLYNCKQGQKFTDYVEHDEMITSCDSFCLNDDTDILLTASSDGILKVSGLVSQKGGSIDWLLLGTFHMSQKGLIGVRVGKSSGDLICVSALSDAHEVVRLQLDYEGLLKSSGDHDVTIPIEVDITDLDHSGTVTGKGKRSKNPKRGISNTELPDYILDYSFVCTLPRRIDVFATDSELHCIGFSVGRTGIVINMESRKILFFECLASVSCMSFYNGSNFAVGDSKGRITVFSVDVSKQVHHTDNAILCCDIPTGVFELNPSNFKTILLRFHSLATSGHRTTDGVFSNFRKISTSITTLIWHAHGVNCLSYTPDGSMLLSGGEEGVLVVWHLHTGAKKFLTRLGSAIFHITCKKSGSAYILSCEANDILFVDPNALVIRSRITGLVVPITIGMKVDKDVNHIRLPQEFANPGMASLQNDVNRANLALICGNRPVVPIIRYWPTFALGQVSSSMGANVAIYTRSNKLQRYNYMDDRETDFITLKNVNILSRQDDDFGEDWELEALEISSDGRVVVTVQGRNVLAAGADGNVDPLSNGFEHDLLRNSRKSLLKFWVHGANGFTEQTKISDPHSNHTTSIRQIGMDYTFVTTSLDSEFKLWRIVRKHVISGDNVFSGYRTVDVNDLGRSVDLSDVGSYVWVCVSTGSYKNMPCLGVALAVSSQILAVSHDNLITFWKTDVSQSSFSMIGSMPLCSMDNETNECTGMLELFWVERGTDGGIKVTSFYNDSREVSRVILNMTITPSPFVTTQCSDSKSSTLVLLTTNFTLETIILVSNPFSIDRPVVKSVCLKPTLGTRLRCVDQVESPVKDTFGVFIESILVRPAKSRKRAKHTHISEGICKSAEWQHRIKHPLPSNMLNAIVDPGCPTCALPSPTVVLNRLSRMVIVRHVKLD
eukprot:XP_001610480.1 WD domain, G-beta repeat containing protein [Babesia bovis T2Bo]